MDGDEELNLESERPVEVPEETQTETETKTEDKHDTDKKDKAPSKDDFDDEEIDSDVGENEGKLINAHCSLLVDILDNLIIIIFIFVWQIGLCSLNVWMWNSL